MRVPLPRRLPLGSLALGVVACAAWYVTASRLAYRWGVQDGAPAVGAIVAFAVAVTLWRWTRGDHEQAALAALRCPRCGEALATAHDHARPGGVGVGVQRWACAGCGYEHVEALTCPQCAA
ncbi:MAG: hypothetical protein EXR65_02655 [Dehalococcoidia bacterium]|nr:hypothetical protein [Dehalococcoidia bacterium]